MTSEFERIRRNLLKSGELFEDPDFPCIQSSVFYHESPPFNFVWKRPFELVSDPKFLSLSPSSSPISFESILGKLGDPWFISSISLLYQTKGLFYRVVPADQSFETDEYAGIFRFRVWWFGQWQEVIIDDKLPTVNNKLVFIHALHGNVFWTCLLEKAIAKLHGSYEALKYGTTLEAMADLTGGVTELIDLKSEDALSSRLLIQRLLNITSIVTAVVSLEDCQSPNFNLDRSVNSSPHSSHHHKRHHPQSSSASSSSPPQFLYPSSSSSPSNGNNSHHRSSGQHNNKNGNGYHLQNNSHSRRHPRDKKTSSSSSSCSSAEAPLHSSFPFQQGSYAFHEDSLMDRDMSSSSTSSTGNNNVSSSGSSAFPRSTNGISGCVNYRITAIERVEIQEGDNREQLFLLRLINPLGGGRSEYRGPFGSKSCPRWSTVSDSDLLRINSMDDEEDGDEYFDEFYFQENGSNGSGSSRHRLTSSSSDGGIFMSKSTKQSRKKSSSSSFWMEWGDFVRIFSHLEVIFLDGETSRDEPSLREGSHAKFPMTVKLYRGIWRKGVTAGGCRNNGETFHLNPQLEITLSMESDDMIVCCLNQHSVLEPQVVGFSIYASGKSASNNKELGSPKGGNKSSLVDSNARLDRGYFKKHKSLLNSSYSNSRQVVLRCPLERGSFIVLPTSFEPGFEGLFSFRVYSMKGVKLRVLDGDNEVLKAPILKSPASFDQKFTQYEQLFNQVSDEHKTVNCHDLQELLEASLPNDYVKSCATIDVCRLIISALDSTGFGRLHFKDYKNIMCSLRFWQNTFKNHTKGTTGILRVEKLEEALMEVGFKLSTDVLSLIVLKFMRKDSTLRFGDFVAAILHLTVSFNLYEKHQRSHKQPPPPPPSSNGLSHVMSKMAIQSSTSSCLSLNDWLKISLQT